MDTGVQLAQPLRDAPPRFDPAPLRKRGVAAWRRQLGTQAFTHPVTMAFLRRFWPTPGLNGYRLITRYDDVREALSRPDVFQVPWGAKMQEMAPARLPFVLATDDAAEHRCGERAIMRAFRREDVPRVAATVARSAERIVDGADERLDAIKDLVAKVPLDVYRDYFGLYEPDGDLALWLMTMADYMLRKIGFDPAEQAVALAAAPRVARVVDDAIGRAALGQAGDTIVARLVALKSPDALPGDALRSTLTGLACAYVPAATMACGHILEVLLDQPKAMRAARCAARADDDDALARCLLEALRFRPIYPGPWRWCVQDYTIAAGTPRATRIRQGEKVLVFLQAAMRDPERVRDAGRFDPDRPASASMVLGYGLHWCVGAHLGVAHLTQVLKPLLVRGFRRAPGRAGRMRYLGSVPEHLTLALDPR